MEDIKKIEFKDRQELIRYLVNEETIYHITVGQLRYIADCALYDLEDMRKKANVKGKWNLFVRNAYKDSVGENAADKIVQQHFRKGLDLFYDINDMIKDDMNQQLIYARVLMDNTIYTITNKNTDLKSQLLYTLFLYELMVKAHEGYILKIQQESGYDASTLWAKGLPAYIVNALQSAVRDFIPNMPIIDTALHEKAIINKILNSEYVNKMVHDAAVNNGNYAEDIKRMDDEAKKMELKEMGVDKLIDKYKKV